ncbi:MAG: type II toxin-antitoxin system RelE/ParE family toxin [Clostridiales Family XIII bacterium]|nr:type II toxin-antitoxin system RelE/ParE family toxin [Clostridiales Family XIII bacterium]
MAYEIEFYFDAQGNCPVQDLLDLLETANGKAARIKYEQIFRCIRMLKLKGKTIREPHGKHLKDEIWELRPGDERVLFAAFDGSKFVLLHPYMKKTQKTPMAEIKKAKQEFADYMRQRK